MSWTVHPPLHGNLRGLAVTVQHEDVLPTGAPRDSKAVQSLIHIAQSWVAVVEEVAFRHVFAVVAGGVGDPFVPYQRRQLRACALLVNQSMHLLFQLAQVALGRLALLPSCTLLRHKYKIPKMRGEIDATLRPRRAAMGYNSPSAMEHDLKLETLLQHLGEETLFPYGSVTPPIVQTTLFTAPSLRTRHEHGGLNDAGYVYTRESNPTVRLAEQKLAALEQTEDALCFASGMAAIASAILTFTRTGDHVVCVESAYLPTRMLLESWLTRYGVEATFVEGKCPEEFERALQPNTRLIYLESPSSMVFRLQDLRAVSQLARERGVLTLCDNSWATPIFQNPHALGIDLVLHSASKYLGGHSDLLAGVVAGRRELIEQVRQTRSLLGGVLEPFGAWLLLRGLRTLPVRMERAHKSGLQVAEWLEAQPSIARVNHPGLPSHPQHALARQQMRGYGSLFSFETHPIAAEQAYAFADRLRLFRFGCSWGGYESLLLGWAQGESEPAPWLFRIYIGLENPDDLIRDLQGALPALTTP